MKGKILGNPYPRLVHIKLCEILRGMSTPSGPREKVVAGVDLLVGRLGHGRSRNIKGDAVAAAGISVPLTPMTTVRATSLKMNNMTTTRGGMMIKVIGTPTRTIMMIKATMAISRTMALSGTLRTKAIMMTRVTGSGTKRKKRTLKRPSTMTSDIIMMKRKWQSLQHPMERHAFLFLPQGNQLNPDPLGLRTPLIRYQGTCHTP